MCGHLDGLLSFLVKGWSEGCLRNTGLDIGSQESLMHHGNTTVLSIALCSTCSKSVGRTVGSTETLGLYFLLWGGAL